MSTMTTKSRLFIDLDGTVARFYDASPNYLEQMYEKGYFRNLQPYEEMTEGIKLFMEQHKDVEVFTLSAKVNGEPPYCEAEKQEWLDEYLPEIDREHRLFTEIGHNKAEYIPNGISNTDVLYDDYNKNLIDWENSGGVALKCHNNINMKGLGAYGGDKVMWEGQVLKNDIEPQEIANSLYETVSAAQSMSSVNGEPLNEAVRTALKLINDYSVAEFGDTSAYDDVLDLSDVALAYTTDSDEEFPIQVSADLENFRIVTEYDNVVAHIDSYNSLEEMNELCFENLNFDDLIYLSEKEKQSAIDKTIIYSTEYNGEIDYFKAADKRLSVLFEKLSKDNTYAELSKAEKISAFEFAEIEQSKNLIASVTFDLDNNNVGIYHLRRAVSEGNRTPNDFISFGDSIAEMKQLVSEAKLNSLNIEKDFLSRLDQRISERSEKNVVDIIDQYNSSGKPFYEFFEENKDKVMATYTDSIDTPYYSRHINRHWLSENFYIENRMDSDTFGSETAKSESTVLVNVYDPSKGSISNKKIDGMSWEERLNLPVETKTIGKHLLEDLKPSESPFILSAYSDLFGEEHIKKAYLKSCVEEAENEIAELRSYEDISPYGGEDVTVGTFESHLYETLIDAREMGYDSIGEVALRCVELGLIDEKKRKDVIYGVYHSVASIKQGYAKGLLSKSDVKYLIDRNEPARYESKDIVDSLLKTKEMSKMRDKLLVAIKLYSAKSENYRNHGDLKESKILDDRVAACIKGYDYYSQQIIDTYNSVFLYVRPENGLVKLETEDIPVSINLNGKQTEFYEHRITTDKNIIQKAYWECMDKCPNMYVPEDYNPFTEEACDELYRLIGENPPQRYEGIQTIKLPFEIADKIDLTLKLVDTELYKIACIENQKDLLEGANLETAIDSMKEKYESSMKVISKIDEIKSKISANEADVESLKGIKPNFVNKVFRHSEIKKREIASANLKNNKAELEQAYSELDRISHSMEYVREKFADYYSENLSSCKPSIKIHFPDDEKSYEIYSLSDIEKISQTSKELNNVLKNGFNERVEDVNIAFYSIYDNKFDLLERERVSAYLAYKMPLEYLNVDKMIQLENMVIDTKGLDYKYIKVPKECLLAFEGSCHRQDIDYAMSSGENTGNYCIARYRSLQEKAVIKTLKTVERAYSEHTAALAAAAQQNNNMSSAATMM
jgi:5'(3')-deoxyribonucleotidase